VHRNLLLLDAPLGCGLRVVVGQEDGLLLVV
jgi:hypothetical protein